MRLLGRVVATGLALGSALPAWSAANPQGSIHTETPLTYIRDYAAGHFEDEDFHSAIASGAPELLVLGKDAPLHHNWGPVAGNGGENQSFGQGEAIRLISPPELRDKMALIRRMTERLHASGVRWIMPYACTMTVAGDPERRTGFWEFYDHWDDYAGFGLGPRPPQDPLDWMQRTPTGAPRFYYPSDSPRYAPNRRWAACIHHPGWHQHLSNVIRLAAEVGYDGVYLDNNRSTRCYCSHCQAAFRTYVAARLSAGEIKHVFGVSELKDVRLNPDADPFALEALVVSERPTQPPALKSGTDLYQVKLAWEFWTDSKVDFLRELKVIGTRTRGAEFHIFANTTAYSKGAYEPRRVGTVASFNQSEENGAETGAHSGRVPPEIGGPAGVTYNRRAFEYKFYQSFGNGMRVGLLTRPGTASAATRALIDQNAQTALLSMAEAAAYGGGGGFKMDLQWDAPRAVKTWRTFLAEHADLYRDTAAWAPIGIIAFGEQFFCGLDKTHQEALRGVSNALLERGVLFDLVHEAGFSLERLEKFRVVIAPGGVRSLAPTQLETFQRYAASARGTLMIIGGDFASLDDKCRLRPQAQREVKSATWLPAGISPNDLLAKIGRASGLPTAALLTADRTPPRAVGINAFRAAPKDGGETLLIHLVNYDVPLGSDRNEAPRPVHALQATVPLPSGWRPITAAAFSPHSDEDLRVEFVVEGDQLRLRVPKLVRYQVVRISTQSR